MTKKSEAKSRNPFEDFRYMDIDNLYERAATAEPVLRAINRIVKLLCVLAPSEDSGQPLCHGCLWETVIKPLVRPLVGHSRGRPEKLSDICKVTYRLDELLAEPEVVPPPADSEIEKWLRSSEAWDTVTEHYMKMLQASDPSNGCGVPRAHDLGEED